MFVQAGAQYSDCPEVSEFAFILWSSQSSSIFSVSTCSISLSEITIDRFLLVVNIGTIFDWVCALHSTLKLVRVNYLHLVLVLSCYYNSFSLYLLAWFVPSKSLCGVCSKNWNGESHSLRFFELTFHIFSINYSEQVIEKSMKVNFLSLQRSLGNNFSCTLMYFGN